MVTLKPQSNSLKRKFNKSKNTSKNIKDNNKLRENIRISPKIRNRLSIGSKNTYHQKRRRKNKSKSWDMKMPTNNLLTKVSTGFS